MSVNRLWSWWRVVRCLSSQLALAAWLLAGLSPAAEKQVQVFLLVGQSNMEGKGNPAHLDTYRDDPLIQPTYLQLKNGDGWKVRDDVWITYPTKAGGAKHGPLTVGYGTKGEARLGLSLGLGMPLATCQKIQCSSSRSPGAASRLRWTFAPPVARLRTVR